MRFVKPLFAISAILASHGCVFLESLGNSCTQEQIVVTWPAAITRNGATSNTLLVGTLTPQNLDQAQFDRLRQALTSSGTTGLYNVVWSVSAFNVNGGYIAFTHVAPLSEGETQQVGTTFEGGGWGAEPVNAAFPPAIALRADNFTATSASGSLVVLGSSPLRLRIEVTTGNAAGETIRVAGEAGFAYQSVQALCD